MGYSSFAKEISCAPKVWAAQTGNLQFYRYHEKVRSGQPYARCCLDWLLMLARTTRVVTLLRPSGPRTLPETCRNVL